MKRLRSRSGTTLIEAMFAVMLTAMICVSLWGVTSFVELTRKQDETQMLITDEARLTMEKILWGYKPTTDFNGQRDGVREAASYQILNNGTQLSYTDAVGTVRQVRLNGTSIQYTEPGMAPAWTTLYAPPAGAAAATRLLFKTSNVSADVVVVDLAIGYRVKDRWFYASIESKVFTRN